MRKNKMMRLASSLMVMTLLTTSVISGTFAKYVSQDSAKDVARVAKWGVSVMASGNLYSDAYNSTSAAEKPDYPAVKYDEHHMTVASDTKDTNIVAPGTKSTDNGLTFSIDGKPEVAVSVSGTIKARDIYLEKGYTYGIMVKVDVTRENFDEMNDGTLYVEANKTPGKYVPVDPDPDKAEFSEGYEYYTLTSDTGILGERYLPVRYKLDGVTSTEKDETADYIAQLLIDRVANGATSDFKNTDTLVGVTVTPDTNTTENTYVVDFNYDVNAANVYAPNTDLADVNALGLSGEKLTWKWLYQANGTEDEIKVQDAKDTILGTMMAGYNDKYAVVIQKGTPNFFEVIYDDLFDVVRNGASAEQEIVASLKTSFSIDLTVTQVD